MTPWSVQRYVSLHSLSNQVAEFTKPSNSPSIGPHHWDTFEHRHIALPRKVPFWLAIHRWYSVWLNEPREDSQGKKTPVFPSCAWWYWRWGIATCEATTKSGETAENHRAKLNFPWNRNATGLEAFEEWCFWYQEESVHRKSLLALGVQKMVALTQEVEFLWMFVVFRWSNIKKGTILDFL